MFVIENLHLWLKLGKLSVKSNRALFKGGKNGKGLLYSINYEDVPSTTEIIQIIQLFYDIILSGSLNRFFGICYLSCKPVCIATYIFIYMLLLALCVLQHTYLCICCSWHCVYCNIHIYVYVTPFIVCTATYIFMYMLLLSLCVLQHTYLCICCSSHCCMIKLISKYNILNIFLMFYLYCNMKYSHNV